MARNRIQFQKGLSEALFLALYGNEEQCRSLVVAWRWQEGFRCPKCGGQEHCIVGPRRLFQCNACRRQTSPMAGTIFNSTKLPLTVWFRAMYLVTQTKQGISSIELGRRLGVTQTTAWKIKTKLAEVMRAVGEKKSSPAASRWTMPISAASARAASMVVVAPARSPSSWPFKRTRRVVLAASSCGASRASSAAA